MKQLTTLPLVYKKNDLAPIMSAKTIDYHYEHLAKNYAINYNSGKGNPRFNKAGNFILQSIFYICLSTKIKYQILFFIT